MKKETDMFRKRLAVLVKDSTLVEAICNLYEEEQRRQSEVRREKQMIGIAKARSAGKTLGRPKLKEPDNFEEIVRTWQRKKINAAEAAKLCGIGVSTFYRRVRDLRRREYGKGRD